MSPVEITRSGFRSIIASTAAETRFSYLTDPYEPFMSEITATVRAVAGEVRSIPSKTPAIISRRITGDFVRCRFARKEELLRIQIENQVSPAATLLEDARGKSRIADDLLNLTLIEAKARLDPLVDRSLGLEIGIKR
jgi:hypothetical protein